MEEANEEARNASLPWVEKFRPKNIGEVAHQEEVVHALQNAIQTNALPHMLLYGPPGVGKTSTALALVHDLFGKELYKSRVLELNASDERGIAVVRTKIKQFASLAVGLRGEDSKPHFKVIILDEADSLTPDAQNALRRTMETYSNVTRFIFICNYISRIIEPLASRCAKFRFKPLADELVYSRMRHIAQLEGITVQEEAIKLISDAAAGDLRKAIGILQSAKSLCEGQITVQEVLDVAHSVPPNRIARMLDVACTKAFDQVEEELRNLIWDGYSGQQILLQVFDELLVRSDISDVRKAPMIAAIAEANKCLVDGADELLQLLAVFSCVMKNV